MNSQQLVKRLCLLITLCLSTSVLAAEPVSRLITVNDASLEYLDWGGNGSPIVFLAGMGDTPYIFNELAPEFTSQFHSYGLTRRGHGRSEQTLAGYTLDELVVDVAEFLNELNLTDVTLVGHSYGGTEVMRLAQLFPDRVSRAVVLDIAYAFQEGESEPSGKAFEQLASLFMPPQERGASLENYRKFSTWDHRSWSEATEANLREQVVIGTDGKLMPRMPSTIGEQFGKDRQNWFLSEMPVPTLFIFSNNPSVDLTEGLAVNAALMNELKNEDAALEAQRRIQINAIRHSSPQATIVELDHTSHRNFIQRRERVIDEMTRFLR